MKHLSRLLIVTMSKNVYKSAMTMFLNYSPLFRNVTCSAKVNAVFHVEHHITKNFRELN